MFTVHREFPRAQEGQQDGRVHRRMLPPVSSSSVQTYETSDKKRRESRSIGMFNECLLRRIKPVLLLSSLLTIE